MYNIHNYDLGTRSRREEGLCGPFSDRRGAEGLGQHHGLRGHQAGGGGGPRGPHPGSDRQGTTAIHNISCSLGPFLRFNLTLEGKYGNSVCHQSDGKSINLYLFAICYLG